MKIAAFNVENLFDRAKAFNLDDPAESRSILQAVSELNGLFGEVFYTDQHLARMRELIIELGLDNDDTGPFAILRQIRGRMVSRPNSGGFVLKARGRDEWVGWVELRTAEVNEIAPARPRSPEVGRLLVDAFINIPDAYRKGGTSLQRPTIRILPIPGEPCGLIRDWRKLLFEAAPRNLHL